MIFYDKNSEYLYQPNYGNGSGTIPLLPIPGVLPGVAKQIGSLAQIFTTSTQAFSLAGPLTGLVAGSDITTLKVLYPDTLSPVIMDSTTVYIASNTQTSTAVTAVGLNPKLSSIVNNAVYSNYISDGSSVYYFQPASTVDPVGLLLPLVGADAATFQSVTYLTGKDKNYTWTGATHN